MQKKFAKTLGQNVCRLRNQAGLTQEQLAERADISRRFLQEVEAGQKIPSIYIAAKIRAALNCSWDSLTQSI